MQSRAMFTQVQLAIGFTSRWRTMMSAVFRAVCAGVRAIAMKQLEAQPMRSATPAPTTFSVCFTRSRRIRFQSSQERWATPFGGGDGLDIGPRIDLAFEDGRQPAAPDRGVDRHRLIRLERGPQVVGVGDEERLRFLDFVRDAERGLVGGRQRPPLFPFPRGS